MKAIDFAAEACRRIQRYRDSYISGELLVETSLDVQRHLESCPQCADDFAEAARLRKAVRDDARREQAPEGLRERVRTGIRQERKVRRRWSVGMTIAAALLLVIAAGWIGTIFVSGHAPHELIAQERYIDSLVERVGAVSFLGLSDHLHCGVYWKILQRRLDEADIERDLGPQLAPLAAIVQRQLPVGYEVRLAHRCDYRGRSYIHFAARGAQDQVLSVILTERTEGDSFASSDGLRPVASAAGVEIFGTGVDGYELTGFELAGYVGFVVSVLGADENRAIAEALLPRIDQFISALKG